MRANIEEERARAREREYLGVPERAGGQLWQDLRAAFLELGGRLGAGLVVQQEHVVGADAGHLFEVLREHHLVDVPGVMTRQGTQKTKKKKKKKTKKTTKKKTKKKRGLCELESRNRNREAIITKCKTLQEEKRARREFGKGGGEKEEPNR